MKTFYTICLLLTITNLCAQELQGSWKLIQEDGDRINNRQVIKIIQDGYFAEGDKNVSDEFQGARGGKLQHDGKRIIEIADFDTYATENIGKQKEYRLSWQSSNMFSIASSNHTQVWERYEDRVDDLTRNWVITGRKRDGTMNEMRPGDRRTVKILSGGRFQWIAFNSSTKEFMGTGGGTYTAKDGKYIENIDFFSRDNSRVGASLEFDYEVKDGQWHHQGKSSKGDPIYEIWSPYAEAYSR